MTLVDQKFGAELVTTKGKVYKFDDANCFMNFYHADYESPEQYAHVFGGGLCHSGKLIPAREAYYLKVVGDQKSHGRPGCRICG